MSIYKPDIKIYYGNLLPENRLIPAPNISISINYEYSNDTIIGYSYIFSIDGTATALDLRNLDYGDEYPSSPILNFGGVIDHIHKLRSILSNNGNILYIINSQDDSIILQARGGILKSFSFDESNNNWQHTASYSASLEFSNVDFMSSLDSCDNVFLDPTSFSNDPSGAVDINNFKIKSFNDNWSFNFGENEAFARVKHIDSGYNLDMNNLSFDIEYSINAVGKHFYIYENDKSKLLPAWEQAKNFVQYRLHSQVSNLLNNVLKNPYSSCSSSDGLDDIHIPGFTGLLSSLGDSTYKVFNEEISCEASESEGSFSATYSATVSTLLGNDLWSHPSSTHTVEKSIQTTIENGVVIKNISISGTIQGLIEGGLIRINQVLQLPNKGSIRLLNNITENKYKNAKILLDKIYSEDDYNQGQGPCGKRDLKTFFKNALGITVDQLQTSNEQPQAEPCQDDPNSCIVPDPPHPSSFNLTHDYINGTITYKVDYNSNSISCQNGSNNKFSQINISTNMPTKIFAEFNIPNSNSCPVIQELGTYTAKKVNVTITGNDSSCIGKPQEINFDTLINCGSCGSEEYLPVELPLGSDYILTQQQYTNNPIDGSFTLNLAYICASGCPI